MFVKICGITNEEDALLAVAMGADAVGFVFAASPRKVAPNTVRDIVRRLPREILTIGVFRDESPERVVEIVNANGLGGAQLHGHESPSEVAWIRKRINGRFVVKAIAADDRQLERLDEYVADAVLIDASIPGSGQTFDWTIVEDLPPEVRLILAGGLAPGNVGSAIEQVRPWGVDVSSGVESAPGRKDAIKVMRFVEAARRFDGPDDGGPDGGVGSIGPTDDAPEDPGVVVLDEDDAHVLDGDRRHDLGELEGGGDEAAVAAGPTTLFDFDDDG